MEYYIPEYRGEIGVGQGVIVLKLPQNPDPYREKEARKQQDTLAKAHSTKSRVYRRNWADYHRRKQTKLL